MTNYEHYKEQMERITRLGRCVAMNATTGEIVCCADINCNECLFQGSEDANCSQKAFKWADEEYKEPEIDWSKVPIDTPVLISGDGKEWYRRYFSGVDENGSPTVFCCGATRWSSKNYDENENTWNVNHIKLAEVSDEESK